MMEESCHEIEPMLVDYADGQLPPDESREVAGHLEECESCRRILAALRRSLELAEVIWRDGLAETQTISVPAPKKPARLRPLGYVAAAAVIVLGSCLALWLIRPGPASREVSFEQIQRHIADSGDAARLLAATELLAQYPDAQALVRRQYSYIIEQYPQTPAASEVRRRIQ
jgi:anti-sigma factor RsiW